MDKPQTYYEWAQVLKVIESCNNDNEALLAMEMGHLEQQSGVYERFVNRLSKVINQRFNTATADFQKAISNIREDSETPIMQALTKLSKEMMFIPKLGKLSVLKDNEQKILSSIIQNEVNRIGESLIKSAQADRTGRLASILKSKGFKI